MELERGIHQMAHGRQPFGIPSPNVYLVQGHRAAMLIDSGYDEDDDHAARMAYIRQTGGPPIMGVLVTHRHRDHAGGAVRLKRDTGAPILCHRLDREAIERERFEGAAQVRGSCKAARTLTGGLTVEGQSTPPATTMGASPVLAREAPRPLSAEYPSSGQCRQPSSAPARRLRPMSSPRSHPRDRKPVTSSPAQRRPRHRPVPQMEEVNRAPRRRREQSSPSSPRPTHRCSKKSVDPLHDPSPGKPASP